MIDSTVNLEFSVDEMRAMADAVVARCVAHIATLDRQPACGDVDAADAVPRACASRRRSRRPRSSRCSIAVPRLDPAIVHRAGARLPRLHSRAAACIPAALADFIADTTNRYTGVWQAAPALVQLEANALDWLRDWMGFPPEARGLFTTGGSMATFNAIVCARERHLGAEIRRGVLYTSDQAHHSVLKSAKLAGVMPDRVRAIASDDRYRLRIDALRDAIAADRRAGLTPFAVVSSAGTTNTGAVDPLDAIADLCAARSDCGTTSTAPTARSSICCDELRGTLRGLPRADSLTLDPHKGMFLPYGTGALLVRDGAALRAAHEATAAYLPAMPHPEDFYDPSQHGPELSRGFPGPARLAVGEAVRRRGVSRRDRREARADARRGAAASRRCRAS